MYQPDGNSLGDPRAVGVGSAKGEGGPVLRKSEC